ncbi:MAG TPA: DNA-formamidopyrimidine glycosylase family protein [Terracidiphilus sp.]|nr:DNA-formamidopyrimidine glycosylase family protein [Terracidiphilus sp.]
MPEGDTIFRTARSLSRAFVGKPLTAFRSTYPRLTRYDDDTPLTGQLIDRVESRGKWLLMHFSGGATLVTHMLMSGSWHIYRHGQPWQKPRFDMRIVLENADYIAVGFKVPVAEIHTAQSLARDRRIPRPEIDVLSKEFDAEAAASHIFAHPTEEIADVLLHQDVTAGVGNVFKSEICFVCGVNPFCRVAHLRPEQVKALVATAQRLVGANVLEDSGDAIVTYGGRHRRTTNSSDPGESLWVYGRQGEPCRHCGEPIRRRIQGPDARVTFWCPSCQPLPDDRTIDG